MNSLLSSRNIFADLLSPVRADLEVVALNSDGKLWVRYQGRQSFVLHKTLQTRDDVARALDSIHDLLGQNPQTLTQASPRCHQDISLTNAQDEEVDIQIVALHPSIAPGRGFPAVVLQIGDAIYRPEPATQT